MGLVLQSFLLAAFASVAVVIAIPLSGRLDNLEERGNFFQGDIILDSPEGPTWTIRNGIIGDRYRWPDNTVVYEIDPEFSSSERAKLLAAWDEIAQFTCIKFREKSSTNEHAVLVRRMEDGAGCSSNVGNRYPSQQHISLEPSCIDRHGTLIHEMIHTIGFYHEQSRPDRDDFVEIIFDKVQEGKEHNFNKYSFSEVTTLDVKYDYGSIMHYSAYGFSIDGSPTIVAKEETNLTMGQRIEMSNSDILKIQRIYGCDVTQLPVPKEN